MPGLNGTGPLGQGPLTGGQRGNCQQPEGQDVKQSRFEFLRGRGRGPGRFQGRPGYAQGGRNRSRRPGWGNGNR
jgi:hypothetical protein